VLVSLLMPSFPSQVVCHDGSGSVDEVCERRGGWAPVPAVRVVGLVRICSYLKQVGNQAK